MIHVLRFADKRVREKLFARVDSTPGLLLVTAVRQGPGDAEPPGRPPFRTLEATLGASLTQLVVVDEGKAEGMWRDPLGDLADRLFPEEREQASAAAHGYLLFRDGTLEQVVRKQGSPEADALALQKALGLRGKAQAPLPAVLVPEVDPWALLGVSAGTPLPEARRAFRRLIAQYHPDKVAHLAPEFRALAEAKTRELNEAWEQLERQSRRS